MSGPTGQSRTMATRGRSTSRTTQPTDIAPSAPSHHPSTSLASRGRKVADPAKQSASGLHAQHVSSPAAPAVEPPIQPPVTESTALCVSPGLDEEPDRSSNKTPILAPLAVSGESLNPPTGSSMVPNLNADPGNSVSEPPTIRDSLHPKWLGIEDQFTVHPVCYACHKIFDPRASSDTCCSNCDVEIFRPAPRQLFDHMGLDESTPADDGHSSAVSREPHVVAPIQLLSLGLKHVFARPGMVSAVNGWKAQPSVIGELRGMQDGKVWKEIKGHDGRSFFFGTGSEHEIRLGVQMRTVLSPEPDAICCPSGEKATERTQAVCPVNGCPSAPPVSESQMRTVLSSEPDAIRFPSGEKATD